MIEIICPSCQREHSVQPSMSGKLARCSCGVRFQVPEVPQEGPPPPPAPASFERFEPPRRKDLPRLDPEPWYYGFSAFIAYIVLGVCCLSFLVLLIALLYVVALKDAESGIGLSVLGVIYLLLGIMTVGFWSAAMLIFVDIARTLRGIRQQRQPETGKEG